MDRKPPGEGVGDDALADDPWEDRGMKPVSDTYPADASRCELSRLSGVSGIRAQKPLYGLVPNDDLFSQLLPDFLEKAEDALDTIVFR